MSGNKYSSINIVIPVYNEGDNIIRTLSEIEEKVKTPHRIYMSYDFDEDNTLPVVKKYIENKGDVQISVVKNKYGTGALNAIKTGFDCVEDGVILVVMGDLSDDLVSADAMFEKINDGYDIVCGSRYVKGGKQIGGPLLKKTLSRVAGVSLHCLTGISTRDITNSFKMYTKKVLKDITIESNGGFEIGMELVVKSHFAGYRIAELPCVWTDREDGCSRFRVFKWLPKYLKWYFYALYKTVCKVV